VAGRAGSLRRRDGAGAIVLDINDTCDLLSNQHYLDGWTTTWHKNGQVRHITGIGSLTSSRGGARSQEPIVHGSVVTSSMLPGFVNALTTLRPGSVKTQGAGVSSWPH